MSSLLQRAAQVTTEAKKSGALVPIATDYEVVCDHGIDFVIRIARNIAQKEKAATVSSTRETGAKPNPFLPYDERLWVANSGAQHAILLNKFNVIDNHLLIVTREYEHQRQLLTATDFAALSPLIEQHGGLGFYNGGQQAGASQHHKHLQWIPGIDLHGKLCIPVERAFTHSEPETWQLQKTLFPMALATLQPQQPLAEQCWNFYQQMTRALGIDSGESHANNAYNLLVTPSHLWIVLRQQESFDAVSLNAMAYAGSLFVKNHAALDYIKQKGPVAALVACAVNV